MEPIMRALTEEGYTNPTPIQQQAIPFILQKRCIGMCPNGNGKTAAFAILFYRIVFDEAAGSRD
jgi:ATP-dependent RNA helicase RhlE